MSLGFIHRQYAAHLFVKPHIHAAQPLGNVLMYGGFTHAKLLCGTAHSSFVLYDILPSMAALSSTFCFIVTHPCL